MAPLPTVRADRTTKIFRGWALGLVGILLVAVGLAACVSKSPGRASLPEKPQPSISAGLRDEAFLKTYCLTCHNNVAKTAGFSVVGLSLEQLRTGANPEAWEKILRRVRLGEMPPKGLPRAPEVDAQAFANALQATLDDRAKTFLDPGRATLRRLNRVEYANAVRDLLAIDLKFSDALPADDSGYGFDNIADVLTVSPTLMDRYIAVAGKISAIAAGHSSSKPFVTTYKPPKDPSLKNQGIPSYNERASDELPLDSRGGASFEYYAPFDATYEVRAFLNANTNTESDLLAENSVKAQIPLRAGLRKIGLSFQKQLTLEEDVQKLRNTTEVVPLPLMPATHFTLNLEVDGVRVTSFQVPSYVLGPRYSQTNFLRDVLQIEIEGPFAAHGPGDTPSRRKIFVCQPSRALPEDACARKILSTLAHRAYRRPPTEADISALLKVFTAARVGAGFEPAITTAVQAILVSPQFIFLQEPEPKSIPSGEVYRLSDVELASRLSLFLWSSIPDDELLSVAERGGLSHPAELRRQVNRMLADPRAEALTQNFAGQWLYLRNVEYQRPDIVAYPQFDARLREAMKTETELFFSSVVRDNRSIVDFLSADYTFLNQRLAEHYGVPGVEGASFRKVQLDPSVNRGGLLGQGSILTVTSYANRTSVVRRGKWILDNILAAPPPPPPPDVPALKEVSEGKKLNAREQMELHRSNPVCASCHVKMDPLGFALENFDAVGAWRDVDAGAPVDASARLPDGATFTGLAGLKSVLMTKKDQFAEAFTERLLTYALGRGVGAADRPAVREIAKKAAADGYRVQSIILGIVTSVPFTMRASAAKR